MTGSVNKLAFSLKSQPGMPSGPCALVVLSVDSFWRTENCDATGTSLLAELSSDGTLLSRKGL